MHLLSHTTPMLLWQTRFPGASMRRVATEAGFSLIELIASLSLISLATLFISVTSKNTIRITSTTKSIADDDIAVIRAQSVIASLINATERLRLSGLVSITTGAHPITAWGAPHPITHLNGTSRPRVGSDILTSTFIDPTLRGRVVKSDFQNAFILAYICGLSQTPSPTAFKKHLLIGSSSICQMRGSLTHVADSCYELIGYPIDTITTPKEQCKPQAFLEYYPTESDKTVFIDRSGNLRLLSHSGLNITENQPITPGLRRFSIQRKSTNTNDIFYSLTIFPSLAPPRSFLIPQRLTPYPISSLVLK